MTPDYIKDLAELEAAITKTEALLSRLVKAVAIQRIALKRQESKARRGLPGWSAARQLVYQARRRADRLCITCGAEPLSPGSKNLGENCLKKARKRAKALKERQALAKLEKKPL